MTTSDGARPSTTIGGADPELDRALSDALDEHNSAATVEVAAELTAQARDADGVLLGGISGWTWGVAAGIAMLWVSPASRGTGLGAVLLDDFEQEAARRGCTHVFVTSFTFQAPAFYERHGYHEIFRWDALPSPQHADIHFRKDL